MWPSLGMSLTLYFSVWHTEVFPVEDVANG